MEFTSFILPIAALLISGISLFFTLRNNRRQIKVSKLEELLEINLYLLYHYDTLLDIFKLQAEIRKPTEGRSGIDIMSMQAEEDKQILAFFESTGQNTYLYKLMRMEVLARSYLPNNKTKLQILSLADMYSNLSLATLHKDYASTKDDFEKYPELDNLFEYSEIIENEIIEEMNLGYESLKSKDVENYRNKLKSDLEIK